MYLAGHTTNRIIGHIPEFVQYRRALGSHMLHQDELGELLILVVSLWYAKNQDGPHGRSTGVNLRNQILGSTMTNPVSLRTGYPSSAFS